MAVMLNPADRDAQIQLAFEAYDATQHVQSPEENVHAGAFMNSSY
jgi:hypothetical protein